MCKKELPDSEFNKHNAHSSGYASKCKKCQRKYWNTWYNKGGKYTKSCQDKTRTKERQNWLNEEKKKHGCAICGYNCNPAALEFHHINPKTKTHEIAAKYAIKNNTEEMKKCIILCANCHREIHNFDVLSQQ